VLAYWNDSAAPSWLESVVTRLANWHVFDAFREDFHRANERLDFLTGPIVPAVMSLLCLLGYFWLRLRHMNKLYEEVVKALEPSCATPHPAVIQ